MPRTPPSSPTGTRSSARRISSLDVPPRPELRIWFTRSLANVCAGLAVVARTSSLLESRLARIASTSVALTALGIRKFYHMSMTSKESSYADPLNRSKKDKYPYGYPGDQPSKRQAHFECKACNNIFPSEPNVTTCPKCFNRNTERLAPKRVEPQPDPEAWKSIQAKLEAMKLK